jgi:diphthamide synthase (EF-2-diphthine--ammonia ligase)
MGEAVAGFVRDGFTHVAFGDLFLDDVRQYRVDRLAGTGLAPLFPLWRTTNTRALAETMIAGGLRATLATVDPRVLDRTFAGRPFDRALLADLPDGVDACGERGEVPHVRVGRADLRAASAAHRGRGRDARRLHLRGSPAPPPPVPA